MILERVEREASEINDELSAGEQLSKETHPVALGRHYIFVVDLLLMANASVVRLSRLIHALGDQRQLHHIEIM